MSNWKDAQRRSFGFVGETCPAVGRAISDWTGKHAEFIPPGLVALFDELEESVKKAGTYPLRDGLDSACDELIDAEESVAALESEIDRLKSELEDARAELKEAREAQHA